MAALHLLKMNSELNTNQQIPIEMSQPNPNFNYAETQQPPPQVYMAPPRMVKFGSIPILVECSVCKHVGPTEIEMAPGVASFVVGGVCLFFAWCCSPLALMIDPLKDKTHYCSNCGNFMGESKII